MATPTTTKESLALPPRKRVYDDGKKHGDGADAKRERTDAAVSPEKNESDEIDVGKLLGFGSFGSTKGKQIADNSTTAAKGARAAIQTRKYRQYMNGKKKEAAKRLVKKFAAGRAAAGEGGGSESGKNATD